LYNNKE